MRLPLWHLTKNPNWELDPNYHPIWGYLGSDRPHSKPAIFVTDSPRYWEPFMGIGPLYAVRIEAPEEALLSTTMKGFPQAHPEYLIEDLENVRVVEILPLEEAIRRGQDEIRASVPWDRAQYGSFGSVEDWWHLCYEVWDDNKMQQVTKCRTRKGLSRLMKEWKEKNPGYKNPMDKHEKEERARRKVGR